MNVGWLQTPVGPVSVWEENDAVVKVGWSPVTAGEGSSTLDKALEEIEQYFASELQEFTVSLSLQGTDFQKSFLQALVDIPFGETRTYGDISKQLGVSAQAIGQACGANPVPILIPCHRVLGADGLGGYSGEGGIETKVRLLKHEGAASLLI